MKRYKLINAFSLFGHVHEKLHEIKFPFDELCRYPISDIEGLSVNLNGEYKNVCPVGCLGCCSDALRPMTSEGLINILTPNLFGQMLSLFEVFSEGGYQVLSQERLSLSGGSNELNNPYCLKLREQLSSFFARLYGYPLGAISSDIAFHVSDDNVLRGNLENLIGRPEQWDNMCIAIDEQMPLKSEYEYEQYLNNLSTIWKMVMPVMRGELIHAKKNRQYEPRLIINFLVPDGNSEFREKHKRLYPGGPLRVTSYEELIARYVAPFVGDLVETNDPVPLKHLFTTSLGRLKDVPDSHVYISKSTYALSGRAKGFIKSSISTEDQSCQADVIRTKIYPSGPDQFTIRANSAKTLSSEDSLSSDNLPEWFQRLHDVVFVGK
jgi:hypothetical protein